MSPVIEKPYFAVSERQNPESRPTYEEIKVRAYQLYVERGGVNGNDVEDWLQAEQELLAKRPQAIKAAA